MKYVLGKKDAQLIYTNVFAGLGAQTSTEAIAAEMTQIARHNQTSQPVYHLSVSPAQTDYLSIKDWVNFSQALLQKLGLEKNQVVIALHNDEDYPNGQPRPHAHLVINLVDDAGKLANTSWDYRKTERALRHLEECYGLTLVQSSWECQHQHQYLKQPQPEQADAENLVSPANVEVNRQLDLKKPSSTKGYEAQTEQCQDWVMKQVDSDEQPQLESKRSYKKLSDILAAVKYQDSKSQNPQREGRVAGNEIEQFGQFLQRYGDQEIDGMQLAGAGLTLLGNTVKIADAIAENLAKARAQADEERLKKIIDELEAVGERTVKLEENISVLQQKEQGQETVEADFLAEPESTQGQGDSDRVNQVIDALEVAGERTQKLETQLIDNLESKPDLATLISEFENNSSFSTQVDQDLTKSTLIDRILSLAPASLNSADSNQPELLEFGTSKYLLSTDAAGDLTAIYQAPPTVEVAKGELEAIYDEATDRFVPVSGRLITAFDYEKEQWVSPLSIEELESVVSEIEASTQSQYRLLEEESASMAVAQSETFPDPWAEETNSHSNQEDLEAIADQLQNAEDLKQLQQLKAEYGSQVTAAAWNLLPQSERDRITQLAQFQEITAPTVPSTQSEKQPQTARTLPQTESPAEEVTSNVNVDNHNPLATATELLGEQVNRLEERLGGTAQPQFVPLTIDREESFNKQLDQIEAVIGQLNQRLDKLEEAVKNLQPQKEISNEIADTLVDHARARAEVYGRDPAEPIPTKSMGTIVVQDQGNYVAIGDKEDATKFEAVKLSGKWEVTTNELSEAETKRLVSLPRDSETYRTHINGRDLVQYFQQNLPEQFLSDRQGTIQWQQINDEFGYKFTIDKAANGIQAIKGVDKSNQSEIFSATIQADGSIWTSKSTIPTERIDSLLTREQENEQQNHPQQKTAASRTRVAEQEFSQ